MKRQLASLTLAALMIMSMVAVPVAAAGGDVGTVQYGTEGTPSFIVTFDNGSYDSLQTWTDEDSRYSIISVNNDTNEAVVTGPQWHVQTPGLLDNPRIAALAGVGVAPTPLEGRIYISEVSPNYRHSYAEPVSGLDSESEHEAPTSGWAVRGSWPTEGIAFDEDANESLMSDVRDANNGHVAEDGSGVRVAVIDTGLNVKNGSDDPLYGSRIAAARNFVSDEDAVAANDYANVSDGNGHGSWVASSIAANATNDSYDGMAPGAELLIGKALDDDGSGSTSDIVDAIRWAEANDADVLSMSLGSPQFDAEIEDALEVFLAGNGTVAYVAVGNSRHVRPAQIASPSDTDAAGVIGVAATNTTDPVNASVAYFSQTGNDNGITDGSNGETRGAGPDVAQPGMSITVPVWSSNDYRRNSTLSGTSMATPIEAGRGVLGLGANPSLENDTEAFAGWVQNTTTPMPNAGVTEVGNGMGSVERLVNLNASEETQEDERNDPARDRDRANGDYGTGYQFQALRKATQAVGI